MIHKDFNDGETRTGDLRVPIIQIIRIIIPIDSEFPAAGERVAEGDAVGVFKAAAGGEAHGEA